MIYGKRYFEDWIMVSRKDAKLSQRRKVTSDFANSLRLCVKYALEPWRWVCPLCSLKTQQISYESITVVVGETVVHPAIGICLCVTAQDLVCSKWVGGVVNCF